MSFLDARQVLLKDLHIPAKLVDAIRIMDMQGRMVRSLAPHTTTTTLDVSALGNGNYVVH